jgi:alkylation response protein AidB-like acyl-CoA dehydrogenase
VNVEFTPEQLALRDSVRSLLTAQASAAMLRQLWATDTGRSPRLWHLLAEVGVPAIGVPEEFGGAGGDELDLELVFEEIGQAALPDAMLESCLLAPYLIATSAAPEVRERWLPLMAAGSARVSVALGDRAVAPDVHVSDAVLIERSGELILVETADRGSSRLHRRPSGQQDRWASMGGRADLHRTAVRPLHLLRRQGPAALGPHHR